MELALKILSVVSLAMLELWVAIPAGLALQLHPLLTAAAAALGGILGVMAVVLVGDRLRSWILRHRGGTGRQGRIQQLWNRYGVVGLGLLAPLLTGGPLGAALGVSLGAPAARLILWMSLGILLWSALITLAGTLGISALEALRP